VRVASVAAGVVHDLPDRVHAAAALAAATEATMDLAGAACVPAIGIQRAPDVVIGEDVAGTDDHGISAVPMMTVRTLDKQEIGRKQKENACFEAIPNSVSRLDLAQAPAARCLGRRAG
jgi:hypothetical protein